MVMFWQFEFRVGSDFLSRKLLPKVVTADIYDGSSLDLGSSAFGFI